MMDRETAIALLNNLRTFAEEDDEPAIDMAIKTLSAKTVQIIQCKDCRWYEDPRRKIFENCVRGGRIIPMQPTDYCSYGKQRKVEE